MAGIRGVSCRLKEGRLWDRWGCSEGGLGAGPGLSPRSPPGRRPVQAGSGPTGARGCVGLDEGSGVGG